MENQKQNFQNCNFSVGTVVFDKFEILRLIGSGGMGCVYKARDVFRNVDIALKVLLLDGNSEKQLIRFQREAQLASKLTHRNIATIYDFGVIDGTAFLTMELVNGESLEEIIDGDRTLSLPFFFDLFIQIAEAINHAHKNGVLHRDLKPANVVVGEEVEGKCTAKILDFGVAKSLAEDDGKLTATGHIIGSPLYMSPEQANAQPLTTKSDLYSLGCMMFRCLVGEPPIQEATAVETIMAVGSTNAPKLSEINDLQLPAGLCRLVDGLLSKSPEDRPPLESDVLPALKDLQLSYGSRATVDNESKKNSESTTVDTKPKEKRTLKLLITLAVFLIIAGLATIAYVTLRPSSQNRQLIAKPAPLTTQPTTPPLTSLSMPPITNRDLDQRAEELKKLGEQLNPPNIKLSKDADDKVLNSIKQPGKVTSINAHVSEVESLDGIQKFENLESLNIGRTKVTNAALRNLVPLKKLRKLVLRTNQISDPGLVFVSKLTNLKELELSDTSVTEVGLRQLNSLKRLGHLDLSDSSFNLKDVESFAGFIAPKCNIELTDCPNLTEPEIDKLRSEFPDLRFNGRESKIERRLSDCKKLERKRKEERTVEQTEQLKKRYIEVLGIAEDRYGKRNPRLAHYYELVGSVEGSIPEPDAKNKMENSYKTAIELNKKYAASDVNLDFKTSADLVISAYRAGALIAAKSASLRAMRLSQKQYIHSNREAANIMINLGTEAHAAKDFQTEISFYDQAIALIRKGPPGERNTGLEAYLECSRGNAYVHAGRLREAAKAFDRCIALGDKMPPKTVREQSARLTALACRGNIYLKLDKNRARALEFLDQAYKLSLKRGTNPLVTRDIIHERIEMFKLLQRPKNEIDQLETERRKYDALRLSTKIDDDALIEQ